VQEYILAKVVKHTERVKVAASNWDDAKKILRDPNTKFESASGEVIICESIEYVGEL